MRRYLRLFCMGIVAMSSAMTVGLAAAQSGPGWEFGMGPGMMGGYGPGPGMGPGMMGWRNYRELNLTADQRSKIEQIRRETRTRHWALMGKMMDAQDELEALYDVDKPDSTAINNQYKQIDELRRQMVDSSIDARNRIDAILTKEQREKSREWRSGPGPMMWGY